MNGCMVYHALIDLVLQNFIKQGDSEFTPSVITFNLVFDAWAK
jgi:hypothetical protein